VELSLAYWLLMFFWVLSALYWGYQTPEGPARFGSWGWAFLIFLLFVVIGYKLFGHPIH